MTHERNIEGLRQSAQLRHQRTMQKLEEGISRLLREGRPVNFNTVAEVAGVSTAWLYQQPQVRSRIEQLRAQQPSRRSSQVVSKASEASRDAMLAALRQRVKQIEAENRELRRQLEVVYGQLYKK